LLVALKAYSYFAVPLKTHLLFYFISLLFFSGRFYFYHSLQKLLHNWENKLSKKFSITCFLNSNKKKPSKPDTITNSITKFLNLSIHLNECRLPFNNG
jgi:hypothetical protein